MFKSLKNKLYLLPIAFFLTIYLLWLFRAYYDVAYMDQMQFLAGNIKHMLEHNATLNDYYYRSPFLIFISNILFFLNCKLLSYNTYLENIVSGFILAAIAYYYCKAHLNFFDKRAKLIFTFLASFIIFCFTKWELSLWSGGFSHYMVIWFGFVCVSITHKYYFTEQNTPFINKYYSPLYTGLAVLGIIETTPYILPFLASILIQLLINYKVFRGKIDLKKWKTALFLTIGLFVFSILINYIFEQYAIRNPYYDYGKVNMSSNLGGSIKKIFTDPIYFIKFYLIANAGTLIAKDDYPATSYMMDLLPVLGLILFIIYGYTIYLFIKRKRPEGVFAINMIISTIIFYATVTVGRMSFNDVFYGGSSRYSALSFTGTLGVSTFFLLQMRQYKTIKISQKILCALPVLFIFIFNLITYKDEWRMAPYRKNSFMQMADNMKLNEHLETLMGNNNDITSRARTCMIRHKLNVFKPETKLDNYILTCDKARGVGIYDVEQDQNGPLRWTNGNSIIFLPNLYTVQDTIKVKLKYYSPRADNPQLILNDNITPYLANKVGDGYEYFFAFDDQKVFFKATIKNQPFKPQELNSGSTDTRTLGLIFNYLTFSNK
ncbi:hypothetical protein A3860_18710 [Niastella vici]|uniref:Glycosyltransferase RgtA/B/C/D-like domain-containing protein n=1 Tax=Niastella vici TaxID=1703345 RepID=A0A1V9G2I9_9BACT|nr:hypothetical protein [Niastella vici]OQP64790.1 hypothetical protein A3860_18710 [Niastella vici]